jgi:hypothetical protein
MSFALDERLEKGTFAVGDLPLSRALLMNDARWPWLILVPRREKLVELSAPARVASGRTGATPKPSFRCEREIAFTALSGTTPNALRRGKCRLRIYQP